MTGIVTSGAGLGSIIFSPLISRLILDFGWRATYLIMGLIIFIVMVSCALLLKREPSRNDILVKDKKTLQDIAPRTKPGLTYSQAVRTSQFWIIALINFVFGYVQFSSIVHIVPYATGLRIPPLSAASLLAVIGAANILGRILAGATSDRVNLRVIFVIVLIVLMISAVCLELSRNLEILYLFSVILGLAYGGASTLQSLMAIEFFGLSSLGVLLGSFGFSIGLGGSAGPVVTGLLFDISGGYTLAFLIFIVVSVLALISTLWLHPVKEKGNVLKT